MDEIVHLSYCFGNVYGEITICSSKHKFAYKIINGKLCYMVDWQWDGMEYRPAAHDFKHYDLYNAVIEYNKIRELVRFGFHLSRK